ncbi:MAG: excinuclease ABC subunit A [Flammeovirgaceae bacterium]|jgi:excinuclease ABC subunit A
MDILKKLADKGNAILSIEHNLDVIKVANHIIDIGSEGGEGEGELYGGVFLKEELRMKN